MSAPGGVAQGLDFGMWTTGFSMKTAPDDPAPFDEHRAHARVGRGKPEALAGQVERFAHELLVIR